MLGGVGVIFLRHSSTIARDLSDHYRERFGYPTYPEFMRIFLILWAVCALLFCVAVVVKTVLSLF